VTIQIDLDRVAENLLRQFWKSHRSSAPEHVYHYTSAEGLCGILQSNAVWATDCRFLNDASESQVGIAKAKDTCRSRRFSSDDDRLVEFYRKLANNLRLESPEPNFIFSLSEREDDLTQWRTYANDGLGFTVGFSSEVLLENSQENNGEFEFSKVYYQSRSQDKSIKDAFDKFEALVAKNKGIDLDNAAITLDWVVSNYSTLFKHSSFRSEKEWRVNTYNLINDEQQSVKVRAKCGRLIPYIPLNLGKFTQDRLPVTRIGIGPSFKDATIKYAVEKLCAQAGFNVEIYNADSPYRRL
jgi:hypothetical protein